MLDTTTEVRALDREFVEDWARRYLDAWNVHDPDAVASLCSEDVDWSDPSLAQPAHGRAGVRVRGRAGVMLLPDLAAAATWTRLAFAKLDAPAPASG